MFRSLAHASRRLAQPSLAVRTLPRAQQFVGARLYSEAAKPKAEQAEAEAKPAEDADKCAAKVEELQAKYDAKDKDAARLKEAYQQSKADFKNLQRTTQEEVRKARDFALQKFAKDLIDTVDNFDLTMGALKTLDGEVAQDKAVKEFIDGVRMVQNVLERTLEKHGITKLHPLGERYNPNEHEAIFQLPQPDKEPGTIVHVDRTGYKLHDRVLRAPKVGIVAEKEE